MEQRAGGNGWVEEFWGDDVGWECSLWVGGVQGGGGSGGGSGRQYEGEFGRVPTAGGG